MGRGLAVAGVLLALSCSRRDNTTTLSSESTTALSAAAPEAPPATVPAGSYYTFAPSDDFARMQVDVCFVGEVPERLDAPLAGARPLLSAAQHGARPLARDAKGILLAGVAAGDCVRYAIDTGRLLEGASPWDGLGRLGDDALLSPDYWLWPPEPRRGAVRARFVAHAWQPAVPWPRDDRVAGYSHLVPESAFVWKSQAAFGKFTARALKVGASSLDVVPIGDGFGDAEHEVMAWLDTSAGAVHGLLGDFPVERALVLLVGAADRKGSFGFTVRGGGPTATLLLPSNARGLSDDWTAVHELLHFALPPMPNADAWLYEGVVTYLTAVARARAGIITPEYGWWELLDGFRRGRRVGTGVTLREEAKHMHENRSYWRVYWAGAAMALSMDLALHQRGQSLEAVIATLAKTRPDQAHSWTSREVMAALDRHSGSDIASRAMAAHVDQTDFPDTDALAKQLGVTIAPHGKTVTYDDAAPQAAIRRAIMSRRE